MGLKPSPSIIVVLVVLAVAFFALAFAGYPKWLTDHLALTPRLALGREPWQLVTYAFVHVGFGQLFSSAIGIWLFGTPVEQQAGRAHLVRLLIGATVLGGLASAALGRIIAPDALVAGAGPIATACIAGFGAVYGRQQLLFFGVQPVKAQTIAFIFLALSGVMHVADGDWLGLAGSAAAAAWGWWGVRGFGGIGNLRLKLDKWRLSRLRRRYRVIPGGRDSSKRYWN